MASLMLSGVQVRKGDDLVLASVDLSVRDAEIMGVIGASGSGKTTLLRVIAGLDTAASGDVWFGERRVTADPPQERNVAMVFQGSVLYPFLTAERNVAFPLKVRGRPDDEVAVRVQAEGRALRIDQLFDRKPSELSAGHRQLVQIAKAMVRAPEVFLLDEPLAMLDAKLRLRMRGELKTVQRGYGVTTVYVTNDPVEAMAVADRIAVVNAGEVVQVGAPEVVYHEPATRQIAELMGEMSFVPVTVESDGHGFWLTAGGLRVRAWAPDLGRHLGRRVSLGLRPEDVEVDPTAATAGAASSVEPHGTHDLVAAHVGDAMVRLRTWPGVVRPGDTVGLRFARPVVFDPDTGVALVTATRS